MNDMIQEFFVNKGSPDYSDTLVVFGLAQILTEIMVRQNAQNRSIDIVGNTGTYVVKCYPGIDLNALDVLVDNPLAPIKAIPTSQYENKLDNTIPVVNLDAVDEFFTRIKAGDEVSPPIDLDILAPLQFEAIQGYNNLLIKWWNVRMYQVEIIQNLLELYSSKSNQLGVAINNWKQFDKKHNTGIPSVVTGQQIFNPTQGEGQFNYKMSFRPKTKPKHNYWITEYLRAVGFWNIAVPRAVGDTHTKASDKDRKVLILEPKHLTYSEMNHVLSEFKKTLFPESHIRFDTLAVLRFLRVLLNYFIEPEQIARIPTLGKISTTLVSGFHSAYYKTMGRGKSLLNFSFIAFPDWIEVYSDEDVRFYLKMLNDIEQIVMRLNESHSDSRRILETIRRFLSSNDIYDFLQFTSYYSGYLMQKRHENEHVPSIPIYLIERIVKTMLESKKSASERRFSAMIEGGDYPGFHNIARAIRHSTVRLQQYGSKQSTFRPRYGLNHDLLRQATSPEKFITALSEFISTYNAETRRAEELQKHTDYRNVVEPSDIDDILRMIDDYDENVRMIAQLLVAYGYADTNPKKREETNDDSTQE